MPCCNGNHFSQFTHTPQHTLEIKPMGTGTQLCLKTTKPVYIFLLGSVWGWKASYSADICLEKNSTDLFCLFSSFHVDKYFSKY